MFHCDKMLNNFDKISTDIDLFLENCDSLIVLGIGNDIRGDDGLGPYIINQLSILKAYVLNNSNIDDIRQEININQIMEETIKEYADYLNKIPDKYLNVDSEGANTFGSIEV